MICHVVRCTRCGLVAQHEVPHPCHPPDWVSGQATFPDRKPTLDFPKAQPTTCGKKMYLSKKDAQTTIKFRMRFKNAPEFLRAYHCEECNAWHLTHKPLFE